MYSSSRAFKSCVGSQSNTHSGLQMAAKTYPLCQLTGSLKKNKSSKVK